MKKFIYHPGVRKPDMCKFRNARNIVSTHIFKLSVCIFIVKSAIKCLSVNEHDFQGMTERKENKEIPKTTNNVYFPTNKNIPPKQSMKYRCFYFSPYKRIKVSPK